MDDDDEFGDLYEDVLRPISSSSAAPQPPLFAALASSANSPRDLKLHRDVLDGAFDPNLPISSHTAHQTLVREPVKFEEDRIIGVGGGTAPNWNDEDKVVEEEEEEKVDRVSEVDLSGVLQSQNAELRAEEARVLEALQTCDKSGIGAVEGEVGDKSGGLKAKDDIFPGEEMEEKVEIGIGGLDSEPIIPGLSAGPFIPGVFDGGENEGDTKASSRDDIGGGGGDGGDDWESDSEDDLQIVLNDKSGPIGVDRSEGLGSDDEDEDGEDLVIVADGAQHHQVIEEQEWGEDSVQATDGERKESGEAARVNGGVVNAVGVRTGYSNHGYHPHHSQFKYVRPGASAIPGGAVVGPGGGPGQVRPLVNMGLIAGRGRGDWRPVGFKTAPAMQKNFHSGFGLPVWPSNSSGRGFGSGLDFTLPSHKTIFDIDIDSFEEKPWRHPGVDISDFFNFGLDEDLWKEYCKQLEQLRLEATMQSRIRVYESGRSEQDYDPDLPPELAAAVGTHDGSVQNAHHGNVDGGQVDVTGQERGSACVRPPIPTGRAIQVESGYGERLPSIDTRPLRMRDSDAIIEIVLQGSMDDDPITANGDFERRDNDPLGEDLKRGGSEDNDPLAEDLKGGDGEDNDPLAEDLKGGSGEEDIDQTDTESFNHFPQAYNDRKRETVGRRYPFMGSLHDNIHEGDGVLPFPSEAPVRYHPSSKGQTTVYPGGVYVTPHDRRWPKETTHKKNPHLTAEHGNDVIPSHSTRINRVHENQRDKSGKGIDGRQTPESSSLVADEVVRETSVEHKVSVHTEFALTDGCVAVEGEEIMKDNIIASDNLGDGSPLHSVKKQKLSSRVEQPEDRDFGSEDDVRATRSSDNIKARSGSSRDYQKHRDGGGEEVVQEGRSRQMGDMKRPRDEDECSFRKKDDYFRDVKQKMDRNHTVVKGKEDSHHSYPHRHWDSNSVHPSRIKTRDFESPRERENSIGAWQRRDGDIHGRRMKDEEMRKWEHFEEMGSRHRSKVRESERAEKDEHRHSKIRFDNGDWRGHHDKDIGPRWRERDDFDDPHTKTSKDEEYQRREQADKEALHGYRAREGRKRERDDGLGQRRDDQPRVRDMPDDHHSRHIDESWRQRERGYRHSLKQSHEDTLSNRERDGRGALVSGRGIEDKSWVGNAGAKDETKGLGSDKDHQFNDKRRQSELPKRNSRVAGDTLLHHRGHEDVYAREHQFNGEDRDLRHERSSIYNDHAVNASDGQWMHKESQKENSRRKESRVDQNSLGSRRKQEDRIAHRSEKASMKAASEQANGNVLTSGPIKSHEPGQSRLSSSVLSKKSHHEHDVPQQRNSSRKHKEDALSDDEQRNSRRGRSKLERWTSHKDRDGVTITHSSSKEKDIDRNNSGLSSLASEQPDEKFMEIEPLDGQHPLGEDRKASELEIKDSSTEPTRGIGHVESDKVGDNRHLDTVAKLKKRSERFKIPMPIEKDSVANRKTENEPLISTLSETTADAEIKPERPARKRRWSVAN